MKILFLSSFGLPNGRIEKSALTAAKNGYEVIFAGRVQHIKIPCFLGCIPFHGMLKPGLEYLIIGTWLENKLEKL
jgi:hypothetical protein